MEIVVNNIINIFTVIDGKVHILLKNNKLIKIECNDDIETINKKYIEENLDIENLSLKQFYTFSEKQDNKLIINILFMDIVNYNSIKLADDLSLIELSKLDIDKKYLDKCLETLRKELVLNSTIKKLYPDEFSLPEIQKMYEDVLDKKYDRRNFRKRLIKLDVIECLEKVSSNKNGRPAKLYKFKDIVEDKCLF
ncbi:MAG: hypothetical protein IJY25_02415 [Bacilli bacterium]|nr:hypothetical protein [Bacilli bacterium]